MSMGVLESGCANPAIESLFVVPPCRYALMIYAYLDESQQTETDRHVVVAGFSGTRGQWDSFLPAWRDALGKRRLHMNSLRWNRRNSEKRIRPLLSRLGSIPYAHGLLPVYGAVRVADYYDLVQAESRLEQAVKGYIVCLGSILSVFMSRYPGHEKINLVCEAQAQKKYTEMAYHLLESFRKIGGPQHPYFATLRFVHKDDDPLTEPADFLAYAIGKRLDENGGKKDAWCQPIHPELYGLGKPWTLPMSRGRARDIVRQVKENRRDGQTVLWEDLTRRSQNPKRFSRMA